MPPVRLEFVPTENTKGGHGQMSKKTRVYSDRNMYIAAYITIIKSYSHSKIRPSKRFRNVIDRSHPDGF